MRNLTAILIKYIGCIIDSFSPEDGPNALLGGADNAAEQADFPASRDLEVDAQSDEARDEAREDLGELEGVRGEGGDGPVAEHAVRVVAQQVALRGVELVRLDEFHGEVGGEPGVRRPLAHEAVSVSDSNVGTLKQAGYNNFG